jgi:hypothetical protein
MKEDGPLMTETIAEAAPAGSTRSDAWARLHAPIDGEMVVPAVAVLGLVALVSTRRVGDEFWITPGEGVGYALGIAGLGAMVALLLYSVRKRWLRAHELGPLRSWFRVHMLLGVLGPVAILFHSNFRVGSRNGAVALVSMLLVAGSGFIGRYVYTRVHHGLFGHRQSLREVARDAESSRGALGATLAGCPPLAVLVRAHETRLLGPSRMPLTGAGRVLLLRVRTHATARRARQLIAASARSGAISLDEAERSVRVYLDAVRRVAEFAFFERVLSLWHAVHVPLCVLLFTAALAHVVAVHRY